VTSNIDEAVEGVASLVSWWINKLGEQAKAVATKTQAGTYTSNDAINDLTSMVGTNTLFGLALINEALSVGAVMGVSTGDPIKKVPKKAKTATTGARQLVAKADFISQNHPGDATNPAVTLPTAKITFDPNPLPANQTAFTVIADCTGKANNLFKGVVTVPSGTDASGVPVPSEDVEVYVTA